ncbi:hypothetical protein [Bacillus pumilus]|nr:hypothetical protein [Bacillus pumilus]
MTKKEALSFIKEMYEEVLTKFNIEKVETYFSPEYQQVTHQLRNLFSQPL